MMKTWQGRVIASAWLPILLLVLWWWATRADDQVYFPSLGRIYEAFIDNWIWEQFTSDVVPSVLLFAGGYVLAAIVGIALGLLLGLSVIVRQALLPYFDFLRAVPAPVFISVLIVFAGFGVEMKLIAIAITAMFPVMLNTMDGVRSISHEQLEMATVYRLSRWDRLFRVILPAASPQMFVGLRISVSIAFAVLIFAEMLSGSSGLGFFIFRAQDTFRIADMWSGIVLIGLIGYLVNILFLVFERRIMRWHRGARGFLDDVRSST